MIMPEMSKTTGRELEEAGRGLGEPRSHHRPQTARVGSQGQNLKLVKMDMGLTNLLLL